MTAFEKDGTSVRLTYSGESPACRGTPSASFGLPLGADAENADGVFCGWTWDGTTLRAWNDQLGFAQLFYAEQDGGRTITVGNNPLGLLDHGIEPILDDRAIAAFLRLGYFLGEDTAFQAVRALPPGGRLTWSHGQLTVRGGYCPTPIAQDQPATRKQAVDQYIELFRQAIQRRLPGDNTCVLPLTGGRDSRHILLELLRQGCRPDRCLTVRPNPGMHVDEAAFAAKLAEHFGLKHEAVTPSRSLIASEFIKNHHTGLLTDEGIWAMMLHDHLRKSTLGGRPVMYDGIAGDSLSASTFLTPERDAMYRGRDFDGLIESLTPLTAPEAAIEAMLPASLRSRYSYTVARDRIVEELERHTESANPFGMFVFWNRTRREIATVPFLLMQDICDVHAPFLDRDLFQFLSTLDVERFRLDGTLHSDAIHAAYPEARQIPYYEKGMARGGRFAAGLTETIRAIPQLVGWQLRHDPDHAAMTIRWAARRLADRGSSHTAPRRMVQYLAHLLSRGKMNVKLDTA